MKYLYIILGIVGFATALTVLFFLPEKKPQQSEVAVSVNGYDILKTAVSLEGKKFGYHADQQSELFDTLITKELLIQEAKRQAIDKEESFRDALKNYYENSLVKILLDRQNRKIQVTVTEDDINRYIGFVGKIVTFTRLDTVPNSPSAGASAKGLTNTALFSDLATPVRMLLSSLQPTQFGLKFDTGSEKYAIRLDSIQPSPDYVVKPVDRPQIKAMLEEYQKEQQMNRWLMELKQSATITIHSNPK